MIKGWRNDPRWVEIMRRREEERVAKRIDRLKVEQEIRRFPAMIRPGPAQWKPGDLNFGY